MAQPNKSRPNRRSSSSTSYASTLTPLLFVALCVLGIWMLTSNSVVSPKTRTAIDTDSATTNDDLSSSAEDTASTSTSTDTSTNTIEVSPETTTKSQDQKDTTIYGDNPGNLPDDAIKNDDRRKQESVSQVPEENTSTPKQEVAVTKEVAGSDNDQKINEFEKELQSTQVSVNRQC